MPNTRKSTVRNDKTSLPGVGVNISFLNPTLKRPTTVPAVDINKPINLTQPDFVVNPTVQKVQQASNMFAQKPQATVPDQPQTTPQQTYTPSSEDPMQSVYDFMLQSQEEEKRLAQQNESKKRLLLLGDALRHLGNLYFTTKGASPQNLTSSVTLQEQRYQQERAQRQAQRQAELKSALERAKQQADQNYKSSMLGIEVGKLQRLRDNDIYGRAKDQRDFEYRQAKDTADLTFKGMQLNETMRHNKVNEGLGRQRNSIAKQSADTAASKANWEMGQNGGLPKGYIQVPHYENAKGGTVSWVVNEDKYKQYLPVIYKDLVDKKVINPIKSGDFNIWLNGSAHKGVNTGDAQSEANFKKMDELVKSAYATSGYSTWMQRLGAYRSDGKQVKVTTTKKLQKRQQAEVNKPKNKFKDYKVNNW